jgi:DNA-directed RNA polymerase subunit RPC12/RpoP
MDIPADSKVHILIRCPQCGGTLDFLEEAQVIHCNFCGSNLLVAGREGVLRYVLPPRILEAKKAQTLAVDYLQRTGKRSIQTRETFLFYAPFWRIQGIVYRWVFGLKPLKMETEAGVPPPMERFKVLLVRVMDHTIPGYSGLEIGLPSLGVRPQVLRLQPFAKEDVENRQSFLPLEVSLESVQKETERYAEFFFQAENLISEVTLQRMVGVRYSVIYFPLWCVEGLYEGGRQVLILDAVGESPVQGIPDGSMILDKLRGNETRKSFEFSELRFLPFRCPNCGWAFPFYPLSILHFCPTCRHLFRETGGEWTESSYAVVPAPDNRKRENWLWVPFWRFRTILESGEERLENMAELYRLAPPPRVVDPRKEAGRPIFFYLPAVRFRNPQLIHTLGSRLTFFQPELDPGAFEDGSHPLVAGGSLSDKDAQEMGLMILGSLIPQGNRKARVWIRNCRTDLQSPQVIYFPFARKDLFWKEAITGISFQHNALSEDLPETAR